MLTFPVLSCPFLQGHFEQGEKLDCEKNIPLPRFTLAMGSDLPFRAVVDLPPQAGSLAAYSATLGHKANHRPPPRNNAIYLPFSVHPVLGRVMSVVALRDIR